jgi:hypothetical protein
MPSAWWWSVLVGKCCSIPARCEFVVDTPFRQVALAPQGRRAGCSRRSSLLSPVARADPPIPYVRSCCASDLRPCHTRARSRGTPSERAVTHGSDPASDLHPSWPSARPVTLIDLWSWLLQVRALPPEQHPRPTSRRLAAASTARRPMTGDGPGARRQRARTAARRRR